MSAASDLPDEKFRHGLDLLNEILNGPSRHHDKFSEALLLFRLRVYQTTEFCRDMLYTYLTMRDQSARHSDCSLGAQKGELYGVGLD